MDAESINEIMINLEGCRKQPFLFAAYPAPILFKSIEAYL